MHARNKQLVLYEHELGKRGPFPPITSHLAAEPECASCGERRAGAGAGHGTQHSSLPSLW